MVRTPAFHAVKPGSIPGAATNAKSVAPFLGKWSGATFFCYKDMKKSIEIRIFEKIRMSDDNSRTISCVISHHYFVQITKLLEMNYCMASMPRYVAGGRICIRSMGIRMTLNASRQRLFVFVKIYKQAVYRNNCDICLCIRRVGDEYIGKRRAAWQLYR